MIKQKFLHKTLLVSVSSTTAELFIALRETYVAHMYAYLLQFSYIPVTSLQLAIGGELAGSVGRLVGAVGLMGEPVDESVRSIGSVGATRSVIGGSVEAVVAIGGSVTGVALDNSNYINPAYWLLSKLYSYLLQ